MTVLLVRKAIRPFRNSQEMFWPGAAYLLSWKIVAAAGCRGEYRMISVVIPTFNEEESLAQLHRELDEVARRNDYPLQIIFVDDGSTDGSWQVIERLASQDDRVLGIRFRRNFGKAAALSAGFDAAEGDTILTMDADLQDDPAEIPLLLAKLEQGFDVVSGWKQQRFDPWHKVWPSRVFNALVGKLTGVKLHDHNCGFKCYRRDVIHEVRLYGELHRFVPVLAASRGYRVGEVVVEHRPRQHGISKYGWTRIPKGLLDLLTVQFITRFGQRPQHWLGTAGMGFLTIGFFGMTYLAMIWCFSRLPGNIPVHLHQKAALYYSLVAALIGIQLLAIGFVAEMIAALVSRDSDLYSVAEHTSPEKTARSSPAAKRSESDPS
ncbi:MAG: glycosyltransferase family 2 protein [Pirellulales bacterium]|nr:glycosyltransferase family 2 protein [Pirellulales bacterium]